MYPFSSRLTSCAGLISHSLRQEPEQDDDVLLHFGFFEFTTGTPHHLSPTHIVSLPPYKGESPWDTSVEIIGDHILVLWNWSSSKPTLHLVSWKTGTVTSVSGPSRSYFIGDSVGCSKLCTILDVGSPSRDWIPKLFVINDSLIALSNPATNGLDIYKLDLVPPDPQIQKLCSLEFPQLIPNAWDNLFKVNWERIQNSKCRRRSGSSRRRHATFYSSTVGTIGLHLVYYPVSGMKSSNYAMTINVAKLLSAIPTDERSVPWEDWGPSSTHLFEISRTTPIPAGPFWITHLSPLTVRDYDLQHIRYTQSIAEGTPPSYSHQFVDTSTETHNEYLEASKVESHLRYRDVMANHLDFGRFKSVLADREWIVGVTNTVSRFCINPLGRFHWSLIMYNSRKGRVLLPSIM